MKKLYLLTPKEIVDQLNLHVIGQDEAKKYYLAVYNHYKRLLQKNQVQNAIEIEKSNVIMAGEAGTGKTLLLKSIVILNVLFYADATVLTGWLCGRRCRKYLSRLLQAADYDVQSTEKGIVFIDEIDKVARKSDNPSIKEIFLEKEYNKLCLNFRRGTSKCTAAG